MPLVWLILARVTLYRSLQAWISHYKAWSPAAYSHLKYQLRKSTETKYGCNENFICLTFYTIRSVSMWIIFITNKDHTKLHPYYILLVVSISCLFLLLDGSTSSANLNSFCTYPLFWTDVEEKSDNISTLFDGFQYSLVVLLSLKIIYPNVMWI